jgi:hypothetical protein
MKENAAGHHGKFENDRTLKWFARWLLVLTDVYFPSLLVIKSHEKFEPWAVPTAQWHRQGLTVGEQIRFSADLRNPKDHGLPMRR